MFIALKMDHCVWSKGGGAGVGGERKKIILKKKKNYETEYEKAKITPTVPSDPAIRD